MLLALALALALATQPAPSPLEGEWKTACLPIGENGRHGFVTRVTVTSDTLIAVSQVYAHSDCDTPTMRTTYRATIAASAEQGGTIDLNHVVDSIEMTLDADDVVAVYNRPGSGCGFGSDWERDVARSVAGRRCAPFTFPLAGNQLYERAWVTGNTLRFGNFPMAWNNSTPDRRPTAPGSLRFERVTS